MRWRVSLPCWSAAISLCSSLAICDARVQAESETKLAQSSASVQSGRAPESLTAQAELRAGIDLTSRGLFAEAIPHFLAADGRVSDEYALKFNLALCYVGTAQFGQAIGVLSALKNAGHSDANIENLLAQGYIGNDQLEEAFQALQRAAALTPNNEKLYLLVADACGDRQAYDFGIRVIDLGLQHLPDSARLHFQRGYFLSMLDEFDDAKPEFDRAASLAPHTATAFLSVAQKNFLAGNLEETIRAARAAVQNGRDNPLILTLLGEALLRSGAGPGQSDFKEAESALTKAVGDRPNRANAQIALGYLFLLDNRLDAAVEHLEKGRRLDPRNPAVYSHLAIAYRKLGKTRESEAMLAVLAQLNAEQATKIRSAPGERKAIPGSTANTSRIRP